MSDFDELWHFLEHRREKPMVQVKEELEFVFNLIKGCRTYLEVGTAEGDSLFMLSHALDGASPSITYVDIGEDHTAKHREEVLKIMREQKMRVRQVHGNSHAHGNIEDADILAPFDVVMIDAGHEFKDVIADAMAYGGMAAKYLIFHDIMLSEVNQAFDWYVEQQKFRKVRKFVAENSPYGYGIVEL